MLSISKALAILIIFTVFISCGKKTETLKEKVDSTTTKMGKEIDTLTKKLGREIDTLVSSRGDTTFKNVKVTSIEDSNLGPKQLRDNINNIFDRYIRLKNELVEGDASEAQKQANELINNLHKAESEGGSEATGSQWKSLSGAVEKSAKDIENSNNIDNQRVLFSDLTDKMLALVKQYGLSGKTIYLLECDKALTGKGGKWLTDSKNTDNPYYGEETSREKQKSCIKVIQGWKFN